MFRPPVDNGDFYKPKDKPKLFHYHNGPSSRGRKDQCFYCGRIGPKMNRDHFIPKSKGGTIKVWCCRKCNEDKKDMMPLEWVEYIKEGNRLQKTRIIYNTLTLLKEIKYVNKEL